MLIVFDQHDAVACINPQHREESHERTEGDVAATYVRGQHPDHQGGGQGHEGESRQAPVPKGRLQQEENPDRTEHRKDKQVPLGSLTLLELTEHLRVVAEGEADLLESLLDFTRHGAQVAPPHVRLDVYAARGVLAQHHVGGRLHLHLRQIAQPHALVVPPVEQEVDHTLDAVAGLGRAPDVHLDVLPIPPDVAGLLARDEGAGGPPHVSGLDAVPRRGGEIHLDPDLWDFEVEIGVQVDDAVDPGHQRLHLLGLLPQDTQVVTVDTHHDGLAGAGEDLFDALPEVGLDIAIQSRVAVDGLLDGRTGLVVVGRLVDADPVLGEVDAVGLVGQGTLPDVGTEVADPGDGAQLLAGLRHDAVHLRVRGARPAHPVHQEVALLEVRKEFLAEPWPHHEAGQHHDTDGGVRGGRRADDPGENRLVSTLKPPYDRGLALREGRVGQENQSQRWGHGQCDDHGYAQGQPIRESQWLEKCAGQALQQEDGQDGQHFDHRCGHDGAE